LGLNVDVYPVSTAAQQQGLLSAWLRDKLQPVLERHHEQAERSIRRKAGALAESVAAALRLKLEGAASAPQAAPAAVEEAERRLRTAAGGIEETRRYLLTAVDSIRGLGEIAERRMVEAILESWREGAARDGEDDSLFMEAASAPAMESASHIAARLSALASSLQSALDNALEVLGSDRATAEKSLEQLVREMPRFEAAWGTLRLSRPRFLLFSAARKLWAARQIRRQAGEVLRAAYESYRRAMEWWAQSTLGEIQREFETEADACRAQFARLDGGINLTPAVRSQLERHLEELKPYLQKEPSGA
jgi:hypothetical protein